jgi:NADH:ubiquinone oxidoreductase subunit 2 (subunit N)
LFNLAGLPVPPAGFFAKIFIFAAGVNMPMYMGTFPIGNLLVGVALLTSVPAIYYYTRVAIKMIVREPSEAVATLPDRPKFVGSRQDGPNFALLVCVIGVCLAGTAYIDPIVSFAKASIRPIAPSERTTPIGLLPSHSPSHSPSDAIE